MDFMSSIPNYTNPTPNSPFIPTAIYPMAASGSSPTNPPPPPPTQALEVAAPAVQPSRYENQKRRDWNTFSQYLRNHRPPLSLTLCSGAHVLEFLRYLDQFGKTKVHNQNCPYFGVTNPPSPCPCPFRQAWGSLDALIGRLRAAFEEHGGGRPELNPFGARAVRLYLREVRDYQAKARGVSYEKKRKRNNIINNINNINNNNNNSSSNNNPRKPFLSGAANPRFRINEPVINTYDSTT